MDKQIVMQPTIPGSRVLEEVGKLHVQLSEAQRTIEEQAKTIGLLRDQLTDLSANSKGIGTAAA